MKTVIVLKLFFVFGLSYAQDTVKIPTIDSIQKHNQIFSLSPISKKVDKVNGIVFGVGHVHNKNTDQQTINGLNIEANPAPVAGAFLALVALPFIPEMIKNRRQLETTENSIDDFKFVNLTHTPLLKLNGMNVSTGCFFVPTNMNGINISTANKFNDFNGISVTAFGTIADHFNGFSIGIINGNNALVGLSIGVYNQSFDLKGVHIGIINYSQSNRGFQIGIFNRSHSSGLQVGLWNVNNKRSMPFLNW